jgi:hypothetical protein
MKRKNCRLAFVLAGSLMMIAGGAALAQDRPANVAGTWTMSATTPRGTFNQTLKIEQDGSTIKGTISGRRGDAPLTGTVKGNEVTFTVSRDTPNGTFTMNYDATADGDAMKGTAKNARFSFDWTAKRGGASGNGQQ